MTKKKKKKKSKKKPRIKENYGYKEMDLTVNGVEDIQTIYKMANQFGYSDTILDEAFNSIDEMTTQYNIIKNVPDRFNHFFAKKGWIAFESLSLDLMHKCVKLAEAGEPKEAEKILIEYFSNRENISFLISRLNNVEEFRPRKALMLNALEDHFNGRYYASVPLFLMLIDGFVNDVERVGFFADKVDLEVWDTIAAHSSGLSAIQKIFNKSRKKTTTEEINLPYRNGILHGRDLGYANRTVSTKALSTLLVLRDWAVEMKKGKKGINKEFIPPTFDESVKKIATSFEGLAENQRQREYLKSWKARDIKVGEDIPTKGKLDEYGEDTPEKAVMQLINYIYNENYGNLANMIDYNRKKYEKSSKIAGKLRKIFEGRKLVYHKLLNVCDKASALSEIEMELIFEREEDGQQITEKRTFRLLYQDEERNTIPRGYKKAVWKITSESIL